MNCQNCTTINPHNANFCFHCGQVLAVSCPQCFTHLPRAANFCFHCGYPVTGVLNDDLPATRPQPGEFSRVRPASTPPVKPLPSVTADESLLDRFLPRDLAAKLDSARASGEMTGESRVVTMLFCDVKGSTAAAEHLDPEDWTEIINGAFEHMITPVYKYEGTVARLMGDGILAFFGAPIAHEDDPQRAVLAGLEITAGIEPYRQQILARWEIDLNVRVGINTGRVIVGAVGSDLRMEYTAMGDAINLAARMEQTAVPGSVQIAEKTYKLVARYFEIEPLGGIAIKGKTEPVFAYRVLGRRGQRAVQEIPSGEQIALVGRVKEWQQLKQSAAMLSAVGQGAFILIIGELGLGKSRLIRELNLTLDDQTTWFENTSLSFERVQSYTLFQRWVRFLAGVRVNDPPAEIETKLAALIADWPEQEQALILRVLATLLGLKIEDGAPPLEGETFRGRLYAVVEALVRRQTARGPLIFAVDDLHWADPASVALLRHLLPLVRELPLIILGAARPDRRAPYSEMMALDDLEPLVIPLKPLSAAESVELVERLLNIDAMPDSYQRWLLEKTEGNPLYVQEVVHALVEDGLIRQDTQGLIWPEGADAELVLPDNIQALLVSRIDRLAENSRRTLQIAALIGRHFYYRILAAIAGRGEGDLHADLVALQEADFILVSAQEPELEYSFRHALTQEAAYKTILRKDRRVFHRRVALAMESLFAGQLEEFSPVMAHHFQEAGDDDKAYAYFSLAGEKAFRLYDLSNALTAFDAALAAYKRLPPTSAVDEAGLLTLYRRRGRVLELALNYDEVMANYTEMEQLAGKLNNPAFKIWAWLAKATVMAIFTPVRDPTAAAKLSEQAVALARELQDPLAEATGLWNLLLSLSFSSDPSLAIAAGERALEAGEAARYIVEKGALAENEDDEVIELRAKIYNDLSRALLFSGRIEEAIPVNVRAQEIYRQRANIPLLSSALINASVIYFQLADYPETRAKIGEAVQISRAIGNLGGQVGPLFVQGATYYEEGRLVRCIEFIEEALILIKRVNHLGEIITCSIYQGLACMLLGEKERGFALGRQSLEAARKISYSEEFALGGIVLLHLLAGDIAGAESAFNSQQIELSLVNWMFSIIMYLQAKAELEFAKGRTVEALNTLETLLERMRLTKTRYNLPTILLQQARVLKALGRQEAAILALQEGLTEARDTGARISLWEIYAELADLTADPVEAARLENEGRAVLQAIAAEIDDSRQRAAFLQRDAARRLLDRSGDKIGGSNDE